jgi:uncharacterized membrane protein YjgN (DUF898 family)
MDKQINFQEGEYLAENRCSQCGATNAAGAKFCGSCGAVIPPPAYNPPPPPSNYIGPNPQPVPPPAGSNSKAVIALVLGIASVFCCGIFTGIPAAILGKMEMDAIKQGRSPESNMGMAKAGFWIGIVGSVLFILGIVLTLFFGLLSSLPNFLH